MYLLELKYLQRSLKCRFTQIVNLGTVSRSVRAEGILDSKRGETRATVVEQVLSIVGSTEVRVAVDTAAVVKEGDGGAEEVSLLVSRTEALEL